MIVVWECSECGGHDLGNRRPDVCCHCGTAGVIFRADEIEQTSDVDNLAATWLRAGFERGRLPKVVRHVG